MKWNSDLRNNIYFFTIITLFLFCFYSCKNPDKEISENAGVYTLTKGDLSFSVSASEGGRIVSFKRSGKEILLQKDVHPKYYGSTLWLSPQCDFWPQPTVLDSEPYQAEIDGKILRLTSRKDSVSGFHFTKEFSLSKDTAVIINYSIENISDTVKYVAPWDVTRVKGGITFFRLKDLDLDNLKSDLNHVSIKNDTLWYTYSPDSIKRGQKLFATTRNGRLIHYYDKLLFIKKFPTVDKSELPKLQGEVEIFLAPNSLYVELENHGKYTKLEKGESLSYRQEWRLYKETNASGF